MTAKIAEACLTSNQYLERIFPKNKLPLYENLIVMIPQIKIEDYNYDLPDERIAKYPLPERDSSKLLRYKDGNVDEHIFKDLPSLLPEGSLMIMEVRDWQCKALEGRAAQTV